MQTADPRDALKGKDVATIAAAARELARVGTLDDLALLLPLTTEHKSTGVRLSAAAAAADILSRYRGLPGQASIPAAIATSTLEAVGQVDPGRNPSLLQVLAALDPKRSFPRLARMLRDPRNTVRAGATLALRRYALSAGVFNDELLKNAASEWLTDKKFAPDVKLELIRMAGELGWTGLEFELTRASAPGGVHAVALTEARDRIDARREASGWFGLWDAENHDILLVDPAREETGWRVAHAHGLTSESGTATFAVADGIATFEDERWRMLWMPHLNDNAGPAVLQSETGRSFTRVEGDALVQRALDQAESLAKRHPEAANQLARSIESRDEELKGPALNAAIRARVAAGDGEAAMALISPLLEAKKPKAELLYWRARCHQLAGRKAEGLEDVTEFLARSSAKAKLRPAAEELQGALS